jgi:FtsZ-interacting cell division protein ZipA
MGDHEMMSMIANLSTRVIAIIVGAVLLLGIIAFGVHSCDQRRSKAAQTRLQSAQGEAQSNSAADAIGTVERSSEAAEASENLSRNNERDIRSAQGASDKVNPAVRDAGIAALCKRQAYENDPRCRHP